MSRTRTPKPEALEPHKSENKTSKSNSGPKLSAPKLRCLVYSRNVSNVNTNDMQFGKLLTDLRRACYCSGAHLEVVREDQSSKWCVSYTRFNGNLGRSRRFKCGNSQCMLQVDRDTGAALMIYKLWCLNRAKTVQRPKFRGHCLSYAPNIAPLKERAGVGVDWRPLRMCA